MDLTLSALSAPVMKLTRYAALTLAAGAFATFAIRSSNVSTPTIQRVSAASSSAETDDSSQKNLFNQPLQQCSYQPPVTGYYRDGYCKTDASDRGSHTVCSQVTDEFLQFSQQEGNDLLSSYGSFPGLKNGDRWCLCSSRWAEAQRAGKAPPVILAATHRNAREAVGYETLQQFALDSSDVPDM